MSKVVKMVEMEGKGRALIATKAVKGGEIVLKDSPILVYSALSLNLTSNYCSNCFRSISSSSMCSCPCCCAVFFCSPNCQQSMSHSHSPWVCQALSRLTHDHEHEHEHERQVQIRFLIAAYNLALVSPSDFDTLLSLQGKHDNDNDNENDGLFLHSLISSLCPPPLPAFSLQLTAALLAKDKLNAFGLMEPFSSSQSQQQRSVRAYGIYPKASFFNHDCLPNACRFEYLDNSNSNNNNTDMIIRAIHDIPQGSEICLSYFPVNLNYSARQSRLRQDYGFTCHCDRCKVEANWSDQEEEEAMEEEDEDEDDNNDQKNDEAMDEDLADSDGDNNNDFPHAYFFLRYMCNRHNCWGTLAPLPPSDSTPSDLCVMECNVCGNFQKDGEEAFH